MFKNISIVNSLSKIYNNKKIIIYLIAILLFSIFSRVLIFNHVYHLNPQSPIFNDTQRYEAPALSLLHTGELAIDPKSISTPTMSTTPGYSLFIAGVYKVFGEDRYPLIIIQILLSSLTILIVYLISMKIWGSPVALIASALMAISPLQVLYSQVVLSETFFILFLTFALLSATYLIMADKHLTTNSYRYKWAFFLGLSIASSTMIRPISYYLVICIVLGLFLFKKKLGYEWNQLAKILSLIMLPAIIFYGSWQVRNGELTGVYEINDAKSETMLYWKANGVLMTKYSIEEIEALKMIKEMLPTSFNSFEEKAEIENKLGVKIIIDNFDDYLKLTLNNLKDILIGVGVDTQAKYYGAIVKKEKVHLVATMNSIRSQNNLITSIEKTTGFKFWYLLFMLCSATFLLTIYFFSALGFVHSFNQSPQLKVLNLLMLGIVIYFIILSTGHSSAYSRMRVPVMPIFILYAAYGVFLSYSRYFSKKVPLKNTNTIN